MPPIVDRASTTPALAPIREAAIATVSVSACAVAIESAVAVTFPCDAVTLPPEIYASTVGVTVFSVKETAAASAARPAPTEIVGKSASMVDLSSAASETLPLPAVILPPLVNADVVVVISFSAFAPAPAAATPIDIDALTLAVNDFALMVAFSSALRLMLPVALGRLCVVTVAFRINDETVLFHLVLRNASSNGDAYTKLGQRRTHRHGVDVGINSRGVVRVQRDTVGKHRAAIDVGSNPRRDLAGGLGARARQSELLPCRLQQRPKSQRRRRRCHSC